MIYNIYIYMIYVTIDDRFFFSVTCFMALAPVIRCNPGEDIRKQAILLADDAGARDLNFRHSARERI